MRKPKESPRNKVVSMRLTEDECKTLLNFASQKNANISEVMRLALKNLHGLAS